MILLLALAPGAARAHPAWGIVADSRGTVFYSDLTQVWMVDATGRTMVAVPNVHTHEVYLDADDTLYGEHLWYEGERTDRWGHRVWKRTRDGKIVDVIPPTEGFRHHYSFVRDRSGTMYWPADATGDENGRRTAIFARAPDGRVRKMAEGFASIRHIAATPDGIVYANDKGRLHRIAPDGSWTTIARDLENERGLLSRVMGLVDWAAGLDPLRHAIMGLSPDVNGDVFLACTGAGVVKKVSFEGRVEVVYRSGGAYAPTGVAIVRSPSPPRAQAKSSATLLVLESGTRSARLVRVSLR